MSTPPSVLSKHCSLAVVVAAVTAASLTAAKKSEGCAWVTAELCGCAHYVGVALMAEAKRSALISKCQKAGAEQSRHSRLSTSEDKTLLHDFTRHWTHLRHVRATVFQQNGKVSQFGIG